MAYKVWKPADWVRAGDEMGKRIDRGDLEEDTAVYEERQRLQNPGERQKESERLRREGQMSAASKLAEEHPGGMMQGANAAMAGQTAGGGGGAEQFAAPVAALATALMPQKTTPDVRAARAPQAPPQMLGGQGQMGQLAPSPMGPSPAQPTTPMRVAPVGNQLTPAEQLRRRQMRIV